MAAKHFQTRTEEEIQQLLRDKKLKSTEKATHNAVKTSRDFCKEQNLDESYKLSRFKQNRPRKVTNIYNLLYFLVGRYNKTLNDWPHGKQ